MRKASLAALVAVAIMTAGTAVMAKKHGGGFAGPSNVDVVTVEQAKNMKDDTHVILRGYIESHLGGEDYMFKDSTGSIAVEIDDDDWNGLTVQPSDLVEIKGEVDTHWSKPTNIDVDKINLIQK